MADCFKYFVSTMSLLSHEPKGNVPHSFEYVSYLTTEFENDRGERCTYLLCSRKEETQQRAYHLATLKRNPTQAVSRDAK